MPISSLFCHHDIKSYCLVHCTEIYKSYFLIVIPLGFTGVNKGSKRSLSLKLFFSVFLENMKKVRQTVQLSVDVCHTKLMPGTTGREQSSLAVILKTDCHPVKIQSGVLLPTHNTRFIPTTKPLQAELKSEI